MNTENVISLEAVSDALLPFRRVKMTATGIDYCGVGDTCIGVILPGDLNRLYPTVHLAGKFVEAVAGNATAIVRGDNLEAAAGGKLVKQVAGAIVGVAVTGATEEDDRFEAILLGSNLVGLTGAQVLAITHPVVMSTVIVAAGTLAIPITHRTVSKATGGVEALSLADGAFLGQKLMIFLATDGGDGTLTPTTKSGFSTIVFADKGDQVDLEWTTSGWIICGSAGIPAPPVITLA